MNRKKAISLITLLVILLNIIVPSFSHAVEAGKAEIKVIASKTEVERGEEITVSVHLNTNSINDIGTLGIYMNYNPEILEPQGEPIRDLPKQSETAFGDFGGASISETENNINFIWTTDSVKLNYNGSLFTQKFKIKEDAQLGESDLEIAQQESIFTVDQSTGEQTAVPFTTINSKVNVILPIKSISLNKETTELWVDETETLTVTYNPAEATEKEVEWTINNADVATVENGVVTAKGKGTAEITATTKNGKTAKCVITVKQPVTGVTLNKTTLELDKGSEEQLTATITPANADGDKTIEWTTNNANVATVENGKVTAKGKGTAEITATTKNGKTAKCIVTVGVPLKGISLTQNEEAISTKVLPIVKGEQLTLGVKYNPEDTDVEKSVTWSSSNTAIAKVENGVITAVEKGEAEITATAVNGMTAKCKIKVEIPVNSITIKESTSIKCGEKEKLQVTINPVDAEDQTIKWTTSDSTIATVSADGTITAVAVGGPVTITATTLNGKTDTCEVTVLPVPLESIQIIEQNITMNKGESQELTIKHNPENTTDSTEVTLTSSSDSVTVEGTKIKAEKAGTAVITATGANGKTATTTVTVTVPLENITLDKTEVTLNKPETITLNVKLNPEDTTIENKTATWTSTDDTVVTVDENGKVTPIAAGTAYIKAVVAGKEATCKIIVKVPLTGISIKSETTILKGKTEKLAVTYEPEGTTYEDGVQWSSSDETVAIVDENGNVTVKGTDGQTAIITAKAEENGKTYTAECKVTVKEIKSTGIVIDSTDFELGIGRVQKLNANVQPENTTDEVSKTWTSSNEEVAVVDANGKVTAISEGEAEITVTATSNGVEFTDTVKVTVKEIEIDKIEIKVPSNVIVNEGMATVKIGEKFKLGITINPVDATQQMLTLISSNSNVLAIAEDGEITAKGEGTAVITVMADNGVKSQVEITVSKLPVTTPQEGQPTQDILPEAPVNTASPKTGDIAIELFVAMMIISAIGIVFILVKNKRK